MEKSGIFCSEVLVHLAQFLNSLSPRYSEFISSAMQNPECCPQIFVTSKIVFYLIYENQCPC